MCRGILIGNRQTAVLKFKNGKEYLVAPMNMLRAGTHSGSNGPIHYPTRVLRKDPGRWNGVPITLGHPKSLGRHVHASTQPHTHIGIVKNARWRANTLRADAWIETSKAPGDLLTLLKMGQRVEVSTGLETVVKDKLLLSFTPDHLAILTDEIGACSIDKGCGLLANNSEAPCKCRKHKERPLLPCKLF